MRFLISRKVPRNVGSRSGTGSTQGSTPMNPEIPPHLMSEANIQARFFCCCRYIGLNVTLEINVPVGRLDVLIFSLDWKNLLAIVECKKTKYTPYYQRNQISRYEQLGVPVHRLHSMDSMPLAKSIKQAPFQGIPWTTITAMPRKEWRSRRKRVRGVLQSPFNPLNIDEDLNYKS